MKVVCRDGYKYVSQNILISIVDEKYPRLHDHSRQQA